MTYYIRKTDGSILTTLTEKELDEQYSMYLIGYPDSVMGIGGSDVRYHDAEIINGNFVRLLENFADYSAPSNPIQGQLWFNKSDKTLKYFDGNSWIELTAIGEGYTRLPLFTPIGYKSNPNSLSFVNSKNFDWLYSSQYTGAYNYLVAQFTPTGKFEIGDDYYTIMFSDGDLQVTDVLITTGTLQDLKDWCITQGYTTTGSTISDLIVTKVLPAQTETIKDITITYYETYDHKKIITPTEETNCIDIYTATNSAYYYIVDIANERFKLPRENVYDIVVDNEGHQSLAKEETTYYYLGISDIDDIAKIAAMKVEVIGKKLDNDLGNISSTGEQVIKDIIGASGNKGGASDKIGSIISMLVSSTYTPDGCLPCDGTEYNKSAYNSFYMNYLAGGKLVTCTYEEYQQDITTYGQCAKFGLDTMNNKFKVPTILNNLLTKTDNVPVVYGTTTVVGNNVPVPDERAGFVGSTISSNGGVLKLATPDKIAISNNGYTDILAKLSQNSIALRFFVVVSNSEELDVPEINKIEFNNPFFFGDYKWSEINIENSSWLRSDATFHSGSTYADFYNWILLNKNNQIDSGISVKTSTETYDDYDYVVNETDGTFRLPLNVKGASGSAVVGNGKTLSMTNGTDIVGLQNYGSTVQALVDDYGTDVGSSVGTSITTVNKTLGVTTDSTKSGIETSSNGLSLYFYVGETLQKTNVINISKLQKRVNDLIFNNREVIRGYLIPDYSAGISISALPYTAQENGFVFVTASRKDNTNASGYISINGIGYIRFENVTNYTVGSSTLPVYINKGDVIDLAGNANFIQGYFVPLKDDKVKVMNKTQLQIVDSLPETPDEDTFYFIKGE